MRSVRRRARSSTSSRRSTRSCSRRAAGAERRGRAARAGEQGPVRGRGGGGPNSRAAFRGARGDHAAIADSTPQIQAGSALVACSARRSPAPWPRQACDRHHRGDRRLVAGADDGIEQVNRRRPRWITWCRPTPPRPRSWRRPCNHWTAGPGPSHSGELFKLRDDVGLAEGVVEAEEWNESELVAVKAAAAGRLPTNRRDPRRDGSSRRRHPPRNRVVGDLIRAAEETWSPVRSRPRADRAVR